MIVCKPYNIKFLTPATCISNQLELIQLKLQVKINAKKKNKGGLSTIREKQPPTRYYELKPCDGCEKGERFLKEWRKDGLPAKRI